MEVKKSEEKIMSEEARERMMEPGKNPLIYVTTNECNVTGWPYETEQVRNDVIEKVRKALADGDSVILLLWDIDNLKGLNDVCESHERANFGIRLVAKTMKERLEKTDGIMEEPLFWRPQSGGDEFNALIIVKKGEKIPMAEIRLAVTESVDFEHAEGKGSWPITSTAGVSVRSEVGEGVEVAEIYQKMVEEAEKEQNRGKIEKAKAYFRETRKLVGKMGPEMNRKVWRVFAERFGPRRMGKDLMTVLMGLVEAKTIKTIMGVEPPGKKYAD